MYLETLFLTEWSCPASDDILSSVNAEYWSEKIVWWWWCMLDLYWNISCQIFSMNHLDTVEQITRRSRSIVPVILTGHTYLSSYSELLIYTQTSPYIFTNSNRQIFLVQIFSVWRRLVWGWCERWRVSQLSFPSFLFITNWRRHHGHSVIIKCFLTCSRSSSSSHSSRMSRSILQVRTNYSTLIEWNIWLQTNINDQRSERRWSGARGAYFQPWIHSRSSRSSGSKGRVSTKIVYSFIGIYAFNLKSWEQWEWK